MVRTLILLEEYTHFPLNLLLGATRYMYKISGVH